MAISRWRTILYPISRSLPLTSPAVVQRRFSTNTILCGDNFFSVGDIESFLRESKNTKHPHDLLQLCAFLCKAGMDSHISLGNHIVSALANVGWVTDARDVFNRLTYKNERSWTALIAGYVNSGKTQHALMLYHAMQKNACIGPSGQTFVVLLKACAKLEDIETSLMLHAEIARLMMLEGDAFIGSSLVSMYAKCGSVTKSEEVFQELQLRDVVSWTSMFSAYVDHEFYSKALQFFEQMKLEGTIPNSVTYVCCLKACSSLKAAEKGQQIHAEMSINGFLEADCIVGSTLVDMYAKCGLVLNAQEVFDKIPVRNVVSWTSLIVGYTEHGNCGEALRCFDEMQVEGVPPDVVAFLCGLKVCGQIGAVEKGQEIHEKIERGGFLGKHLELGNAILDMYVSCGLLSKAQDVFEKLPGRDVVTWTTLIAGYVEDDDGEEALKFFERMQLEHVSPDKVAFLYILKACGNVGAIDKGQDIHVEIEKRGLLLNKDIAICNTLIDMYGKCGSLCKAQEVFDKILVKDIISWTALIEGYAQQGESENACQIFDRMVSEGLKPDSISFFTILNACKCIGLYERSETYFQAMSKEHGICPNPEHHFGMIGVFCVVGKLEKVATMIRKQPYYHDAIMWRIVLDACRNFGDVEFGKKIFDFSLSLDAKMYDNFPATTNMQDITNWNNG